MDRMDGIGRWNEENFEFHEYWIRPHSVIMEVSITTHFLWYYYVTLKRTQAKILSGILFEAISHLVTLFVLHKNIVYTFLNPCYFTRYKYYGAEQKNCKAVQQEFWNLWVFSLHKHGLRHVFTKTAYLSPSNIHEHICRPISPRLFSILWLHSFVSCVAYCHSHSKTGYVHWNSHHKTRHENFQFSKFSFYIKECKWLETNSLS